MMNVREKPKKRMFLWGMVFLCLAMIYYFSSQTALQSGSESRKIVELAVNTVLSLSKTEIPSALKAKTIGLYNNVGRECMHAIVFFVLALFIQMALISSGVKRIKAVGFAFSLCMLFAVLDECHQLFVPGRAFEFVDILMDCIGMTFAMVVLRTAEICRKKAGVKQRHNG